MTETKPYYQLSDALQLGPSELREWLTDVWNGPRDPKEFNWLGLAEATALSATSAVRKGDSESGLAWARLAVLIYQHLIDRAGAASQESLTNSMMMLRVFMINKLGSIAGDPILDAHQVVRWFFDSLPLTTEQVVTKSKSWNQLDLKEILELRRIKSRICIIAHLSPDIRSEFEKELEAWLAVQKNLP